MQILEPGNQHQTEVELTAHLAEFRTALREEIEAGKRNAASSAISLLNGRKIAQLGSAFQYLFDIENALNLPGDTPADLRVPGKPSLEATIISIEGMAITLSVTADLGQYVSTASLQSNMTLLLRKLISRIEAIGNLENLAGDRILGIKPVSGAPASISIPGFHPSQSEAVAASLGLDTIFIWGPPGTGKTYTIGEIGAQLFNKGQSLLLVSHTNSAVDQALLKIADKVNDKASLEAGKVLRIGEPKDKRVADSPELLLQTHIDRHSHELAIRRETLALERENIATQIKHLSRLIDLCEWVAEAQRDIRTLASDLDDLHSQKQMLTEVSHELERLLEQREFQAKSARDARRFAANIDQLSVIEGRIRETEAKIDNIRQSLPSLMTELANAKQVLEKAAEIEPHRLRLLQLPPMDKRFKSLVVPAPFRGTN
jgi:AAA domain-containing protein